MRLSAGDWQADIAPESGGAVAALSWRGGDVLRPTPAGTTAIFDFACFPLVPYANRIAHGRFAFAGEAVAIPRNHPRQAHPLHGVGWRYAWEAAHVAGDAATLTHRHAGDEHWPWRYAARQEFRLSPDGLRVSLYLTNEDTRPMPASLGLHPYFPSAGVTALRFAADGVWLADDACLPRAHAPADALGDWRAGAPVRRGTLVDHCYTGWDGLAVIARQGGDVRLEGEGTEFLHVYMPPGEDFFCAEPVTAMPDAFNQGTPMTLAPGETRSIAMAILRG